MPIRRYKPTSAGRRFMSVSTFEEVTKPGWKKAVVHLRQGDKIEIFEGAQL